MRKRIFCIFLCLCILVTLLPAQVLAAEQFRDVPAAAWYREAVRYVSDNGIMTGTGGVSFSPDATLTRAQLCQILYNLEGSPTPPDGNFQDVPRDAWYRSAVDWAAGQGIVSGTGSKTFSPDLPITREQTMTILYRYAGYKGYDQSAQVSLTDYQDLPQLSSWAQTAMRWAAAEHLITGTSADTISPQGTTTRAQAALILMRFGTRMAALEAFRAKDMDDFPGKEILNFDDSRETNFAVLSDEAVVSNSDSQHNRLVRHDETNGIYEFSNIDQTVAQLSPGDVFYWENSAAPAENLLLKVGEIRLDGNTAVITEGTAAISDYFQYIDLDTEVAISESDLVPGSAENGIRYEGAVLTGATAAPDGDTAALLGIDTTIQEKFTFSVDHTFDGGSKVTGTLEDVVKLKLKCRYDFQLWGKDYWEFHVQLQQELNAALNYTAGLTGKEDTKRFHLMSLMAPIGSSGVWLDGDLYFLFDIDADMDLELKTELCSEYGFQYNSESGFHSINECESKDFLDCKGSLNLSLGPGAEIGVSFLKIITASVEGAVGLEVSGTTDGPLGVSSDEETKHSCMLCVDGKIGLFAEAAFKVKLGISENTSVTPVNQKIKSTIALKPFYISYRPGAQKDMVEFGWGKCPYIQYRLQVRVTDDNSHPIPGAKVFILNSAGEVVDIGTTDAFGLFPYYLLPGDYEVSVDETEHYQAGALPVTVSKGSTATLRLHSTASHAGKYAVDCLGMTLYQVLEFARQNGSFPTKKAFYDLPLGGAELDFTDPSSGQTLIFGAEESDYHPAADAENFDAYLREVGDLTVDLVGLYGIAHDCLGICEEIRFGMPWSQVQEICNKNGYPYEVYEGFDIIDLVDRREVFITYAPADSTRYPGGRLLSIYYDQYGNMEGVEVSICWT